jgi:hypothetical protein
MFDPLVAFSKARVVQLAETGSLSCEDAGFLCRALFDLESDGIGLFDGEREVDPVFLSAVSDYLAARVGAGPVRALALGTFEPATATALPSRAALDNAATQLVIQSEVKR